MMPLMAAVARSLKKDMYAKLSPSMPSYHHLCQVITIYAKLCWIGGTTPLTEPLVIVVPPALCALRLHVVTSLVQ
jgi:hypothetical protein